MSSGASWHRSRTASFMVGAGTSVGWQRRARSGDVVQRRRVSALPGMANQVVPVGEPFADRGGVLPVEVAAQGLGGARRAEEAQHLGQRGAVHDGVVLN